MSEDGKVVFEAKGTSPESGSDFDILAVTAAGGMMLSVESSGGAGYADRLPQGGEGVDVELTREQALLLADAIYREFKT